MTHTPHKPLPAGCDQQGRYDARQYQAPTDDELLRRATDSVVARYRNGQPHAGEAVPPDDWAPMPNREALKLWAALYSTASAVVLVALCAVYWSELSAAFVWVMGWKP